ncbi:MAG: M48 family metallopeptidase [Myxococcota bacterium]|nr:M48 family metallopeptidase [Myxococcota bacterium]
MPARFPNISSRAWEHPADRAALDSLRKVPGFDLVVRKVMGLLSERPLKLITLGSAVEVGPDQFPHIHALYDDVLQTLDAPERYPLFVTQNPVINAGAVGMDHPFIVLNSATLQQLDDVQVRSVLGHEIGHILSDHVLYKTMLRFLLKGGQLVTRMPLTGLALLAVIAAMLEWDRKSELSADRASLLACQDIDVVRGTLLRMAGGVGEGASVEAFRSQARRYEEGGSAVDSVIKTLALLNRRHPFPVQRMGELDRWIESGAYAEIMSGAYPLRDDDPEDSTWHYWRESVESYAEGVKQSADPVARWMRSAGTGMKDKASGAWEWIRGRSGDATETPAAPNPPGSEADMEAPSGESDPAVDPDDIIGAS